jgi:NADH:ubiquinone oxidoreductase subunit 6 (subunit J)
MLWNARLTSRNVRLWVVALACSLNLIFGTFLLANSLGIWYYHFYALQVVKIVIFSPFLDWLIWSISTLVMVAGMVGIILLGRREKRIPLWTAIPDRKSVV